MDEVNAEHWVVREKYARQMDGEPHSIYEVWDTKEKKGIRTFMLRDDARQFIWEARKRQVKF